MQLNAEHGDFEIRDPAGLARLLSTPAFSGHMSLDFIKKLQSFSIDDPVAYFTDEEFEKGIDFASKDILHELTPLQQVESAYRQNFTDTGLVLPPHGGLHRV